MYGEEQIQENLHAAHTLKLLQSNEFDFLSSHFSGNEVNLIKKRIVETILNTDMAMMKKLREDFQTHLNKFSKEGKLQLGSIIDNTNEQTVEYSKQIVSNVVMHSCDISTSLRGFETSVKWADLLFEEFFNQGDCEKAHSLEISMMCDRTTTEISCGQEGFIKFVVLPIFYQMNEICPEIEQEQIAQGNRNIDSWKNKAKYEQSQVLRDEIVEQAETSKEEEKNGQ